MSIAAIALSEAPISAPTAVVESSKTPARRLTIATAEPALVPQAR